MEDLLLFLHNLPKTVWMQFEMGNKDGVGMGGIEDVGYRLG